MPWTVLSASLVLAMLATLACTPEQTPTEPSGHPSLARAPGTHTAADPTLAVHPSEKLDPDGRTVTVIGRGLPADVTVQLSQCTGSPLVCQELVIVNTDKHGMFISRVLVAFDFTVLNPFPSVPTCSEPTFTGDACLLFAVTMDSPFASAFEPITFSH